MDVGDLRSLPLFTGTDDERLRELARLGTEVPFAPGDEPFREGRPADFWWVLVEGSIDLVRHVGREEMLLATVDVPGRWAGGFRAWDEHGAYMATARAQTFGRFFRVPAPALREWVTTSFPLGVHLIEGLFRTVRSFETATREKEALIALGTLAAGLAHELNNPASAAARAADALAKASDLMQSALRRLAEASITAEQFTELDALRLETRTLPPVPDAMARADREEALMAWLSHHGVRHGWSIAAPLAAVGVEVSWCERVASVLGSEPLEPGLEWVASALSVARLLDEVRESTRRISDLVSATRSYAQLDRAPRQPTDVTEGLDSTLAMLAHRIPPGVTVQRDYDDVPRIEATGAELNQVWTNLIANALDAMAGQGTLRVSARVDPHGGVVVEIGDTGTGMTDATRAHAFDPFFTTKGVGEGTGLGLDLSRRIVERHTGDIAIDLRPGETVLRVRLPPRS
jgi:signal transduction histidine kinase